MYSDGLPRIFVCQWSVSTKVVISGVEVGERSQPFFLLQNEEDGQLETRLLLGASYIP